MDGAAGVDVDVCLKSPKGRTALENLRAEKLIEVAGNRVVPTLRGMLLADSLPLSFV